MYESHGRGFREHPCIQITIPPLSHQLINTIIKADVLLATFYVLAYLYHVAHTDKAAIVVVFKLAKVNTK